METKECGENVSLNIQFRFQIFYETFASPSKAHRCVFIPEHNWMAMQSDFQNTSAQRLWKSQIEYVLNPFPPWATESLNFGENLHFS